MKRLGELLVERNAIQPSDLEKALYIQRDGWRETWCAAGPDRRDLPRTCSSRRCRTSWGSSISATPTTCPEQLDVYRVMSESLIKLDWFLDPRDVALGAGWRDLLRPLGTFAITP